MSLAIAMSKAHESNLSNFPITPVANARSIRIEVVAAVKLFKIEEPEESLAAASCRRPCEAVAASVDLHRGYFS